MKLEQIVTLANHRVRLPFLAMERSLRAAGCRLPLKVIPYDENRFELPPGSEWWEQLEVTAWLKSAHAHPAMRKYHCLTLANFQFVDSDVCFLRNPEQVLAPLEGFVTSCGHWHNPDETVTDESRKFLAARSTTWQKTTFNTGQWACDQAIYTPQNLRATAERPEFSNTCILHRYHEQPGVNLLVNASGIAVQNLTLPPWNMQSTWAGDYPGVYRGYWDREDERPYLIHWAGTKPDGTRPVDDLFFEHLTNLEREEWMAKVRADAAVRNSLRFKLQDRARKVWRAMTDPT